MDVGAVIGFGSAAQLFGVDSGELVTDGIYRFSRNPQYLGIVMMLAGASLARRSADALLGSAVVAVVFDRWIRHEETNLSRLFGDEYTRYRTTTSRWLRKHEPPT